MPVSGPVGDLQSTVVALLIVAVGREESSAGQHTLNDNINEILGELNRVAHPGI